MFKGQGQTTLEPSVLSILYLLIACLLASDRFCFFKCKGLDNVDMYVSGEKLIPSPVCFVNFKLYYGIYNSIHFEISNMKMLCVLLFLTYLNETLYKYRRYYRSYEVLCYLCVAAVACMANPWAVQNGQYLYLHPQVLGPLHFLRCILAVLACC